MSSYEKWAKSLALSCAAALGAAPCSAADTPARLAVPAVQGAPTPVANGEKVIDLEVIRERYPDRTVKVERHVTQDGTLNYLNHGPWTMWDPQGNVLAKGEYWQGKRHGEWKRFYSASHPDGLPEAVATGDEALNSGDFKAFKRPLTSQATFVEDKLVGTWTVTDADGKLLFAIDLDRDTPQGKLVTYYQSGTKRREIEFKSGVVNGEWQEWDANGTQTRKDLYLEGRRQAEASTKFDTGEKSSEGTYLYAKEIVKVDVDWWAGSMKVAVTGSEGKTIKQGRWQYWYEDGGKRCEAEYVDDKPIGRHSWWFRNGQKESEGEFVDGLAQGTWTYWHENGQKAAQGDYLNGRKVGRWVRWSDEGKVAENKDHGAGDARNVQNVPNGQNIQTVPTYNNFPTFQPVPQGQPVPTQVFTFPQPGTTTTSMQPTPTQVLPAQNLQPTPANGSTVPNSTVPYIIQGQPTPQPQYVPQYNNTAKKGLFKLW